MKYAKKSLIAVFIFSFILMMIPAANVIGASERIDAGITEVQKYGNVVLNIKGKTLTDAGYEAGDILDVSIHGEVLSMPLCTSFSDVDTGSLLIRDDRKNDTLLLAINMGNFSETYSANIGDNVSLSLKEKQGYLSEYLLRQLKRTNERSDYASDSIFANFRGITTTGIAPGVLYRGSSPVNNELGRAAYSDTLARAVGVNSILNLADNIEEINGYIGASDFKSYYYKSLLDGGNVKPLDMDVNISGDDFSRKLAEGIRFMAEHNAPYMVHCTEGKDRAGFVSAVLSGLMGASMDEIVKDYMVTYENYYHVERGSAQYKKIADANIVSSMTTVVFGMDKGSNISGVNVSEKVSEYLLKIGVSESEINSLKRKLSGEGVFKQLHLSGVVTEIEKYGHAGTDISIEAFNNHGFHIADMLMIVFDNGYVMEAPYLDGYLVAAGYPLVRAYPGQTNIALCINYGKLNELANVSVGSRFTIMMDEKQGYLAKYQVRKLERTNNRDDYASDEIFANFRNISMGDIAPNMLYRSSSPVNNELGRAAYADVLISRVGIAAVVNLADSADNIEKYISNEGFASPYYAKLYKENRVKPLNLGLNFNSPEFKKGIAAGVEFMADNNGPYLIHCTEGKDRAGYMAVFLEALMGADKDQIIDDYMTSYYNYYKIPSSGEQYEIIKEDVTGMLRSIAGGEDLSSERLSQGAHNILTVNGLSEEKISLLKNKLAAQTISESADTAQNTLPKKWYTVVSGDSLWKISQNMLGDGRRYMDIYNLNRNVIRNVNKIFVGQRLVLP